MVSVAVGNRRLLALADLLAKLPRTRFDYNDWVGTQNHDLVPSLGARS
jgi:hypothetical protein